VTPADGLRLALVSTLGLVTEVRVKGDGPAEVLKVTALFREEWARDFVARDLRWLFAAPVELTPAGRLADGRLVLEGVDQPGAVKARYSCSADGSRWEELEIMKGSRRLFHASFSGYRHITGLDRAIPAEITADAGTHQLHLRIAAIELIEKEGL
jgi:hypothetical protein